MRGVGSGAAVRGSPMNVQLFLPTFAIEECLAEIRECLEKGWTGLGYKTVANTLSLMKIKLGAARTADLVRLAVATGVS